MARCRNFDASFVKITAGAADTEFAVFHELGRIPKGMFVLRQSSSTALLYRSVTPASTLGTNFIAGWEFEDNGNLGLDSGPNALHLTNTVSPVTQVAGKVGNAGNFVAASSQYLYRASEALLQAGDIDFTLASWVNLTTVATNSIVGKDVDVANKREYNLGFVAGSGWYLSVFVPVDVQKHVFATSAGLPSAGVWYFVVGWHDAAANTINIQVNNGTVNSAATGASLQAASNAQFDIGDRQYSTSRVFMNGAIDQVMFWKRVLTSAERTQLYNGGAGVTVSSLSAPAAETSWTNEVAYLKSTVTGAEFYVLFF